MFYCSHCSQLSTIMFSIVTPDLGSTVLFHIVDNCEQSGQQNIVQSCYIAGSEFLVYAIASCGRSMLPQFPVVRRNLPLVNLDNDNLG